MSADRNERLARIDPAQHSPRDERVPISNEAYEDLVRQAQNERATKEASERQARLERANQAKEVDHVGELTSALANLENAVIDYRDNKDGQVNWLLVNARQKVVLLQAQVDEAMKELQVEESKGSWIDQLDREIATSESAFQKLVDQYSDRVMDQIVKKLCGESRTYKTASKEVQAIVRDHERTLALRRFTLPSRPEPVRRQDPQSGRMVTDGYSLEYLYKRAEAVAQKLAALRSHVEAEEESAQ
jgi:hypothetical protein